MSIDRWHVWCWQEELFRLEEERVLILILSRILEVFEVVGDVAIVDGAANIRFLVESRWAGVGIIFNIIFRQRQLWLLRRACPWISTRVRFRIVLTLGRQWPASRRGAFR